VKYFFSKTVDANIYSTEEKVRGLLKEQGFGVLTEIDVQATLKKKLDVDFRRYKILGACNPQYAHEALLAEDKIGLMLPCNVIIQEIEERKNEVVAIDPVASMASVDNKKLKEIAVQIRQKLETVINTL
jgi:uncharacterized protein (DUF302 family)